MLRSLIISLTLISLLSGCSPTPEPTPPPIEDALFCDLVTERYRYTQAEIDVRAAKWPANLRREFEVNKHFDRECKAEATE